MGINTILRPILKIPTVVNVIDKKSLEKEGVFNKDFGFFPIPKRLRYHPDRPFDFGLLLNISFGIVSTLTVANLYYCQPILIELSKSFHVTYNDVSRIPTLLQAGYATGLLFITPLGDLVRRRQLILILILISASLTIGLATTSSLAAFETISFLVGTATVTPQVVLPLAADLAPPERRATAISVVLSGLLFGILVARVLSGIIAQFVSWRIVYFLAIGLQYFLLVGCYLIVPDYPSKNKGLTYCDILLSMAKFTVTEPLLIQSCLVSITSSACFSSFWVTLTFLLAEPPYNYSTVAIGLFGLLGMAGVAISPLVGRAVDKLVPWYGTLISTVACIAFQAIQVGAGGINVGAVIVVTIGTDVFRQMTQVSTTMSAISISAAARSRLNAVLIISIFIGQVMGTAVGTRVFTQYGWRVAAALSLAWYTAQLVILLIRGPHCSRNTWFGWEGGVKIRRSISEAREKKVETLKKDIEQGAEQDEKKLEDKNKATLSETNSDTINEQDMDESIQESRRQ